MNRCAWFVAAGALLLSLSAGAGEVAGGAGAPEVHQIIEALRPQPAGRSRNIVVRPRAEAASGVAAAQSGTPAGESPAETRADAKAAPSLSLAIGFEPNSARLRPESGPALGTLMAAMIAPELRASRFVIEGHTDAAGSPAQNQRLSQLRAEEVRLYLVTLGVAPERLRAVGRGANDLARPDQPLAAENRRVRVVTQP